MSHHPARTLIFPIPHHLLLSGSHRSLNSGSAAVEETQIKVLQDGFGFRYVPLSVAECSSWML